MNGDKKRGEEEKKGRRESREKRKMKGKEKRYVNKIIIKKNPGRNILSYIHIKN